MRTNIRFPHQPIDCTHLKKFRISNKEPLEFRRIVNAMMTAVISRTNTFDWRGICVQREYTIVQQVLLLLVVLEFVGEDEICLCADVGEDGGD
jgi:hypothetical protein